MAVKTTKEFDVHPYRHQHYNTGQEPCRFVALHASTAVQREERGVEQIEFEDEGKSLREMYHRECARNGVAAAM